MFSNTFLLYVQKQLISFNFSSESTFLEKKQRRESEKIAKLRVEWSKERKDVICFWLSCKSRFHQQFFTSQLSKQSFSELMPSHNQCHDIQPRRSSSWEEKKLIKWSKTNLFFLQFLQTDSFLEISKHFNLFYINHNINLIKHNGL